MRKLAFLMLSIAATPAFAADLPSIKGPPVYAPPPPLFSWTGLYVGGNIGYGGLNTDETANTSDPVAAAQITGGTVPGTYSLSGGGITAGGQIGFNYEIPTSFGYGIVAGIEADYAYMNAGESSELDNGITGTSNIYHISVDSLGTVRARLGFAVDRALIYATGGFAFGHAQYSHSFLDQFGDPIWAGGASSERSGYAVGAGIEYALPIPSMGPGALTVRAEYLHYDLGTGTATIPFSDPTAGIGPFIDSYHLYGNLIRAGLNYKFDLFEPPAPVIAKY